MSDKPVAVLALFPSAQALMDAVPKVREKNLGTLQAYTPYPVHGLDKALGLKPSPLGIMVFAMGALGATLALLFEWWTSASDYPVRIGGKAFFSWQAFVPVMFEVTVLFAAFTAGLGMITLMNRLPWFGHPVLHTNAIKAITRDGFALAVEAVKGELDVEAATAALEEAGGAEVEVVFPCTEKIPPGPTLQVFKILAVAAGCAVAGITMYFAIKLFPVLPPMADMEEQVKAIPYESSACFEDGMAMRPPVDGTVARGMLPMGPVTEEASGSVLVNPLAATTEVLAEGRERYEALCIACHGPLGNGKMSLSKEYKATPANFHGATVKAYADGRLYYAISKGKNAMAAYAVDLTPEERWAVVHYIRALQRSQDAPEEDLP